MGAIRELEPVKLFVGFIASSQEALIEASEALRSHLGPTDMESEAIPFNFTHYYESEMGGSLIRKFASYERLVRPEELVELKLLTQAIENDFGLRKTFSMKRPANLDPGYIGATKLVLATTKDASHRIYLGRGIFAEITLQFRSGAFAPLPWTYPDYRTQSHLEFFSRVRLLYLEQLRGLKKENQEP